MQISYAKIFMCLLYIMEKINCIVFCGGKCGGSSLTETIRRSGIHTVHLHDFNCYGFNNNLKIKIGKDNIINLLNNSKDIIYIFDVYRTPVERKISSFFQNITLTIPDYKSKSCEELIDIFNTEYINHIEEYHSINNILDAYELEHFKNFDFQKRYNIIKKGNLIFVKILFRDINKWDKILSEILIKNIKSYNHNLTENKVYYDLYNEFKQKYKIPKKYIDDILKNDKEFKIYNTEEEQESYISYWLNRSF